MDLHRKIGEYIMLVIGIYISAYGQEGASIPTKLFGLNIVTRAVDQLKD